MHGGSIPRGLCQCGCGQPTSIPSANSYTRGVVKGEPMKFVKGHHMRARPKPVDYAIDDNGCWVWQRYVRPDGYGRLRLGHDGPQVLAHRHYYEKYVGSVPSGLVLDHLCRNRACVNPAHLEVVTHRENWLRSEAPSAVITRARLAAREHHSSRSAA